MFLCSMAMASDSQTQGCEIIRRKTDWAKLSVSAVIEIQPTCTYIGRINCICNRCQELHGPNHLPLMQNLITYYLYSDNIFSVVKFIIFIQEMLNYYSGSYQSYFLRPVICLTGDLSLTQLLYL